MAKKFPLSNILYSWITPLIIHSSNIIRHFYTIIAVTGSIQSIGSDCGQFHHITSDNRLERPQNLGLEKSVIVQHIQPSSNDIDTASVATSTLKENVENNTSDINTNVNLSDRNLINDVNNLEEKQHFSEARKENVNLTTVLTSRSTDEETVVRCVEDNSDSGSVISLASSSIDISSVNSKKTEDGDSSSVKSKKRRSFFNFRRSKKDHKKEVLL